MKHLPIQQVVMFLIRCKAATPRMPAVGNLLRATTTLDHGSVTAVHVTLCEAHTRVQVAWDVLEKPAYQRRTQAAERKRYSWTWVPRGVQ
jgi:hypothetical protein